jgi:hypothetical protein
MARYYFHFRNESEFIEDEIGYILIDRAAARVKGIASLRSILAEDVLGGVLGTSASIEIENEDHELVLTISFHEALQIVGEVSQPKQTRLRLVPSASGAA